MHGASADRAVAGQRTAVNLADIEPAELARGDVLSEPGVFRAVQQVDCRLRLLPTAKPLKHRAPVHFHSGTAEIEAQVRLLEGTARLQPGQESGRGIATAGVSPRSSCARHDSNVRPLPPQGSALSPELRAPACLV